MPEGGARVALLAGISHAKTRIGAPKQKLLCLKPFLAIRNCPDASQGAFAGAICALQPAYLIERFPTEVRGTASASCYHFATILGGLVPPTITYPAVDSGMGFPQPMLYGTIIGAVVTVVALVLSPETKSMRFTSEVQIK
jgi:MFS family permease